MKGFGAVASVMHRCSRPVESRSGRPKMISSAMSAMRKMPSNCKLLTENEIKEHLHISAVLFANFTCRGAKLFLEETVILELIMLQLAPVSKRPWSAAVGSFGLLVSRWMSILNKSS